MNYAAEKGSGAMIYIHNKCHKDWFRLSKVNGGRGFTDTQTAWRSHKPILIFQHNEGRLRIHVV
jgi:hypothetical protein